MKKIILTFIYFVSVVIFILLLANYLYLTEDMAIIIFISAIFAYLLFVAIVSLKHKIHKPRKSKHKKIYVLTIIPIIFFVFFIKPNEQVEIPDSLITFAQKYPENLDFVNDYPKNYNKDHNIDIKNEVTKGVIPLFIQWDKRWGYESYGNNFLAVNGCGPTCLSMVFCGLTGDTSLNPLEMAKFSESQGYYISGQGTSWSLMTEGAEMLGLNAKNGTISEKYILENLTPYTPMICSMYPGDFTYTGHFIVLTGIDSEGKIIVNDPNSIKNSNKHWAIEEILPQIRNIWIYSILQ